MVTVGKQGVTDALIESVSANLEAHELIKVRFNDHKDKKKGQSEEIAASTRGEIAGIVGHVLILYREHDDPEKRRVDLVGA